MSDLARADLCAVMCLLGWGVTLWLRHRYMPITIPRGSVRCYGCADPECRGFHRVKK